MARRRTLPEHVRSNLTERVRRGSGHHHTWPTGGPRGDTITADEARAYPPSPDMMTLIYDILGYLTSEGARQPTAIRDPHCPHEPGAVLIRWGGDVTAEEVARTYSLEWASDGTVPLIPAWLSLAADDDFDLRWQAAN